MESVEGSKKIPEDVKTSGNGGEVAASNGKGIASGGDSAGAGGDSAPVGDDWKVTLEGTDGSSHTCQILDVFTFESRQYAALLSMEKEDQVSGGNSIIIMRVTARDDQSVFQTIETEEEFERVQRYLQELVEKAESGDAG